MAWWPGSLNPFLFWGEGVQPKLTIIFLDKPDMGVEPKIGGFLPPNHPFVHKVFHEKSPSILGVKSPIFWKHPYIFLGNVDYGETNVNVLILKIYTGDQNQKNCRKQIVAPQHIYIYTTFILSIYIYKYLFKYIIYIYLYYLYIHFSKYIYNIYIYYSIYKYL